jgi:hypothetical protein
MKMKEVPINWCSETDLTGDEDMDRTNAWYSVYFFIRNPRNARNIEDLKADTPTMYFLAALQRTNAIEIEVYEDHRHKCFGITAYFEDEESCVACAVTYGDRSYTVPSGGPFQELKTVEKTS